MTGKSTRHAKNHNAAALINQLYSLTARLYETHIGPAFRPLADHFCQWLVQCYGDHVHGALYDPFDAEDAEATGERASPRGKFQADVIDIGTGTGLLARLAKQHYSRVLGIDLSVPMLSDAKKYGPALDWLQADLQHIPLRKKTFDIVCSTFGLNLSEPKPAFRSLAALLRSPQSLLVFQEWGAEDELSHIVDEVFEAHCPADIPGLDADLSEFLNSPKPWYEQLQDAEDYYAMLKGIGFGQVWVREAPFVTVRFESVNAFLRYKHAWATRQLALAAMTHAQRTAYEMEVSAKLRAFAHADGSLAWSPPLFRVCATGYSPQKGVQ